jgi:signal transduction histidine kinase
VAALSAGTMTASQSARGTSRAQVPRRRLAIRLAWFTTLIVLVTQAMFVVPVLVRLRHEWLDRRLAEAEIAALSASATSDGTVDRAIRDELLRQVGAEAIRLERPGQSDTVLGASAALPEVRRLDPEQESLPGALSGTFAALTDDHDELIAVEGTDPLRPNAKVVATLRERELHHVLVSNMLRLGTIRLCIAIAVGILVYALLMALLVRPIQRLAESIAAFRADPEHSRPLDETVFTRFREDEVAAAGRELAAMQRELRAALWRNARLAALGAAMAKVNHDLRGILSPVLLTAERLQMNPDPSIKRAGDVVMRSVERAADLTRRTLEFARQTPHSLPCERMKLHPVVENAVEQVRPTCPMLSVVNHVAQEVEIDADRESLLRVLTNLVRNAGEADALRVTISAEREHENLVITVADDGPGLPDSVRAALFRPFVAGGRRGSTGLGLAIVHDLMRAHGGDVSLVATGPDGTKFRLSLPHRSIQLAARAVAIAT